MNNDRHQTKFGFPVNIIHLNESETVMIKCVITSTFTVYFLLVSMYVSVSVSFMNRSMYKPVSTYRFHICKFIKPAKICFYGKVDTY